MEVVYVHGWGTCAKIWLDLIAEMQPDSMRTINLGFWQEEESNLGQQDYVMITHSMGTLWALEHLDEHCKAFIVINGFTRFTNGSDFHAGYDRRVVQRMIRQFSKNPQQTWTDFMRKAQLDQPFLTKGINLKALEQGLEMLLEADFRSCFSQLNIPKLAIYGSEDQIVSEQHMRACFGGSAVKIEHGGHFLQKSHPKTLSTMITEFMDCLA